MQYEEEHIRGLGEEVLRDIKIDIAAHGFAIQGVVNAKDAQGQPAPNYLYTLGMTEKGWPELLLIGNLDPELAGTLIYQIAERWHELQVPFEGRLKDFLVVNETQETAEGLLIEVNADAAVKQYLPLLPVCYPDRSVRVMQILWPDDLGNLPTSRHYSTDPAFKQPVLTQKLDLD